MALNPIYLDLKYLGHASASVGVANAAQSWITMTSLASSWAIWLPIKNIIYLDLTSGVVKTSHHTQFDEAWNPQPFRSPAAQLLYDLGLEFEDDANNLDIDHESTLQIPVP